MSWGAISRAGLLAAVASAALALPASSLAATVAVEELPGKPPRSTNPNQSKLAFVAAAGEANRLTVSVAGEEGDFLGLRLVDTAAAIQPGLGCGGGGAAGTPVLCRVHKPTVGDSYLCYKECYGAPGTAWDLTLRFALGDGGSRLDTTALPAGIPNHEEFSPSASVEVTILPGAGDDTILTGPEPDVVDSSPGADLVRTGDGSDVFRGGPVPDGPDDVDLGNAVEDVIDYLDRATGISYEPNGRADDGAAGEGDNLGAAGYVFGGAGGDTLVGAQGNVLTYGAEIIGGGGDDTISGTPQSDSLSGGTGDDELIGGAGNDMLKDPLYYGGPGRSGDDSAEGGPGRDEIELGTGDDEADGGPDGDRIVLGPGSDSAAGGGGDDLLLGEGGRDSIDAGAGNDRLSGDTGSDRLLGGAGEDRIAAGMTVFKVFGYRAFLESPGPLEGRPDQVGCGTGRDEVRAGLGDAVTRCETVLRAEPVEMRGFAHGGRHFPPQIQFSLRSPGTARLAGDGVIPKTRTFRRSYGPVAFYLRLDDRAHRSLRRDGQVKLRPRLSFRAVSGREVDRTFSIQLWKSGEVTVFS